LGHDLNVQVQRFDYLALGSGLAGLAFALQAAEHGSVCVLTKAEVADANTSYAQGGIAAAVGEADSWKLHEQDTLRAGAGLCDPEAVRFLVQHAPEAIQWLRQLGASFTLDLGGNLELGLEGGHSRNRIVHFQDRTGWEVERVMVSAVRNHPNIKVAEHAFVTNLAMLGGKCVGAVAELDDLGSTLFLARATLLATGGCGKLYQQTTNPRVATGDGIALASAVGADIRDMEFMQFHPTTLYHPQLAGFLITEACRGAGATLRNHLGRRFMYDYDDRLELAPRDVVARAMFREMERLGTWCLYLDMTHLDPTQLREEFPTIWAKLEGIGIDMSKDWIPVVPAQHYSCGGVATDLNGSTSISGLYAAGEVASTGVHGANRLASNSLLEAMVFAKAAAHDVRTQPSPPEPVEPPTPPHCIAETDALPIRRLIQRTMTERAGIVRTFKGLAEALETIDAAEAQYLALPKAPFAPYPLETWNIIQAALHVVKGALNRKENVGLHFNLDLAHSE
jgi:L-aspartate oxidase